MPAGGRDALAFDAPLWPKGRRDITDTVERRDRADEVQSDEN